MSRFHHSFEEEVIRLRLSTKNSVFVSFGMWSGKYSSKNSYQILCYSIASMHMTALKVLFPLELLLLLS